jgi:NAD(P)-dependent dehydrogenase (short-subunit alcohol dehydrogenase family)
MGKPLCCQRMQSRRSRAISSLRWSLNSQTRVIARVISTRDITLITGANKGLGYETARRLIDLGHTVLVGARDPRRGTQAAHELGGVYLEIDPTDDDSVHAAAAHVRDDYGHLDVLINNAGTSAPRLSAEDLTADAAMEGFAINVFGPIRVMHAFLPLLRAAEHPRIVNVSSGVGGRSTASSSPARSRTR